MAEKFSGKIEAYDLPIDFTKCRTVCIERRWKCENAGEYLGGIDSDGHERKDNFAPEYETDTVMFKYDKEYDCLGRHSDYNDYYEVTAAEALSEIERHLNSQRHDENYSTTVYDENGKSHPIDANKLFEKAQLAKKSDRFAATVASMPSRTEAEISSDFSLADD